MGKRGGVRLEERNCDDWDEERGRRRRRESKIRERRRGSVVVDGGLAMGERVHGESESETPALRIVVTRSEK